MTERWYGAGAEHYCEDESRSGRLELQIPLERVTVR
jgi:hypothetical protein